MATIIRKLVITFSFNLIVVLILLSPARLFGATDLIAQYGEVMQAIRKVIRLNQQINELQSESDQIDDRIGVLEEKTATWLTRRKIAKLTGEKADIHQETLNLFQQISDSKQDAYELFTTFIPIITDSIYQHITQLEETADSTYRKTLLEELIELNAHRNSLIALQTLITPQREAELFSGVELLEYFPATDDRQTHQKELLRVIDSKIGQLDQMITAAEEEQELKLKLDQFASEMLATTDESGLMTQELEQNSRTEYSTNGPMSESALDGDIRYGNWEKYSIETLPQRSQYDYLFLINRIDSPDLPTYIARLDSIRHYYLKQKELIANPK